MRETRNTNKKFSDVKPRRPVFEAVQKKIQEQFEEQAKIVQERLDLQQQTQQLIEELTAVRNPNPDPKEKFFVVTNDQNVFSRKHARAVKRQMHRQYKPIKQLAAFALVAIFVFGSIQAFKFFAEAIGVKSAVLGATTTALSQLDSAKQLASQKQFSEAQQQFVLAEQSFVSAKNSISSINSFLTPLLYLTSKGKSASNILDAGQSIAKAGMDLNNFYSTVSGLHITPQGIDSQDGLYAELNLANYNLKKANAELADAQEKINSVSIQDLPEAYQDKFTKYQQELQTDLSGLNYVQELISLVQSFFGQSQKTVLVLFENNNEQRATGGFIGTYGYFRFQDGKIISQQISSSYDLDGQLTAKIAPPGPLHDATDRWGIRDSNWFVDFPASAQKAINFYEKEKLETPDAVIAMTPDVFVDLLKQTGPIDFPKYGVTLDADNFRDLIQTGTSLQDDPQPKQMLADFAPLLLQKLFGLDKNSYPQVLSAVINNLNQKNILIYDRNPAVQNVLEQYNWSGKIASTDRDFLAIYDTNIGGRKTDLKVSQQASLKSEIQPDGSVINTLTLTRSYNTNNLDADTNIDYVRVLAPLGSTFISAQGFTRKDYYPSDGSGYIQNTKQKYEVDPDLQAIDASSRIDGDSGTVVTAESAKAEFANWMVLKPGDSQIVTIKYKLPFKLADTDKYSLLVQKQPGSVPIDFSYNADFGRQILWYIPDALSTSGTSVEYKGNINSDLFIGAVMGSPGSLIDR